MRNLRRITSGKRMRNLRRIAFVMSMKKSFSIIVATVSVT